MRLVLRPEDSAVAPSMINADAMMAAGRFKVDESLMIAALIVKICGISFGWQQVTTKRIANAGKIYWLPEALLEPIAVDNTLVTIGLPYVMMKGERHYFLTEEFVRHAYDHFPPMPPTVECSGWPIFY